MNHELQRMTKEWTALERKTLEQREKAQKFYDEKLMCLIEEEFIHNNKDEVFEDVDHMVISVGTSYEPIVLSLSLFRPEKILFLYTSKSEHTLSKIVDYCGLTPENYAKRLVDEVDPMDVYREIKQAYLKWKCPKTMYIDFTGGTKAMSAACALAAAMIDVQMVYVSTEDYLTDFRKPNPGTERISYVENPLAVFGDLEMNKAMELFGRFNFAGAAKRMEVLKDKIPDAEIRQQLQFVYLLAKAYEYWDALNFIPAYEYMNTLFLELTRDHKYHADYLLMDYIDRVGEQRRILKELRGIPELQKKSKRDILENKDTIHALMLTMLLNASTREQQEKLDMATLLFYRLLEMIEQRRLIQYGLYASDPEYAKVRVKTEQLPEMAGLNGNERMQLLKERAFELKKQMFKNADMYLPQQIALLDGFIILAALRDPITRGEDGNPLHTLSKIRSKVSLRNNSIFAHGLGPVTPEEYVKFRDFVTELFIEFCRLEGVPYEECTKQLQWIQPKESRNYLTGWEA